MWARRLLGTSGILLATAWLSQLSCGSTPETGVLRLSWRTNGEEIKIPIHQDPNLPAHMRLPEGQAYDARIRPYRLQLSLDGQPWLDRRIEPPGVRHDRPLSVFQEFVVAPGEHDLEVRFSPEAVEGAPPPQPAEPFRIQRNFSAGQVHLITLDAQGAWLVKP